MKILVTGGAGFIGSHTLTDLHKNGHQLCVVDSFRNSSFAVLKRVSDIIRDEIEIYESDIRDADAIGAIFNSFRPDAVVHFAGLKSVGESKSLPLDYYDVNIAGTLSLLKAMHHTNCKRIVFSSSATVYGDPCYLPLDEIHPCSPINVYGRTKYMAEQILEDWQNAQDGASVVILRYFNPVGAHVSALIGESPQGQPNNLMPLIAQVAIGKQNKINIFGGDYATPDGTGMRDYIHVMDLARAHSAAIDFSARHHGYEIFNIGTGQCYSVLEMINAFSRISGRDIPYEIVSRRTGDVARSVADPSKANKRLGWHAFHTLDEMCESTFEWQTKNPKGFW